MSALTLNERQLLAYAARREQQLGVATCRALERALELLDAVEAARACSGTTATTIPDGLDWRGKMKEEKR